MTIQDVIRHSQTVAEVLECSVKFQRVKGTRGYLFSFSEIDAVTTFTTYLKMQSDRGQLTYTKIPGESQVIVSMT